MNALKAATIELLNRILPERIKNSIFHLSFHLAGAEFEKFSYQYSFAPNMKFGLAAMAARGFNPQSIIDVGAFEGNWSKLAKQIWPASRLIIIEPNQRKKALLSTITEELKGELFCELLGAEDGQTVQFNLMESGSSIMSERSAVARTVESRRLSTLSSLLKDIDPPGLLKIDAQGYELEILRGSSGIMPAIEAVLLEIAIIEINEGAPLLHDVITFMKSLGFITYDILEIHRRPLDGALNQVDIIFIREQSNLLSDKRHFE
jgi:FkbM family methyltransferase